MPRRSPKNDEARRTEVLEGEEDRDRRALGDLHADDLRRVEGDGNNVDWRSPEFQGYKKPPKPSRTWRR